MKITNARAAELAAIVSYADRVTPRQAANSRRRVAAALPDLLADRAELLDALRRAETHLLSSVHLDRIGVRSDAAWHKKDCVACAHLADLRALLASAEAP